MVSGTRVPGLQMPAPLSHVTQGKSLNLFVAQSSLNKIVVGDIITYF